MMMSDHNRHDADDHDALALDPDFASRFAGNPRPPCQLYLVSPLDVGGDFPDRLKLVLTAAAVAAFQFRVKGIDQHEAARLAAPLRQICADADVAFIVNDDVSLAKRIGADGVHLGQGDGDPREARLALGSSAQIGVTCHNSRHLAMAAGEAGADYVAFGAFYPTTTKLVEHFAEPSILGWWTTVSEIPCVAIGGLTVANSGPVIAAGADFVAVSSAIWNCADGPAAGARAFAKLLAGAT